MGCNHTRVRGVHYVPPFSSIRIPVVNPTITDIDGNTYTYVTIGTQQWLVENLSTTKYADGTPISNIAGYNDWFLPSKDTMSAMITNLKDEGVGGFIDNLYMTSSEFDATNAYGCDSSTGLFGNYGKGSGDFYVRPCRAFTSTTNYNLRDIGPSGGYIFWKSGNDYLEAAPSDIYVPGGTPWSNIDDTAIGTTGTAIGTGQANTTAIINQAGHTTSAAKLCDDLTSDIIWSQDTTGAYCWYNNDMANKADYGALYNWYAVNNIHELAPTGWRVPSETDCATLVVFVGGDTVAGGKLKEEGLVHWQTPNEGATDDYGFKLLGTGCRDDIGQFLDININTWLWTSTLSTLELAGSLLVSTNFATSFLGVSSKEVGFSVRCVRDV